MNKFDNWLFPGYLVCPDCGNIMRDHELKEDDILWCCHNEHCTLETYDPEIANWWPLSWPKYALKRIVWRWENRESE